MENWKIEKDLCRCCHSEGSFRPLTDLCTIGVEEGYYTDMLRLTLQITLKPVEGPLHPHTYTICEDCAVRVKDATSFKQQVRQCEERFQDMYSRGVIKLEGVEENPVIKQEPETDEQKMDLDDGVEDTTDEPHRPWEMDGDDITDDNEDLETSVKVHIEVCKEEPDPIDTKRRSTRTKKTVKAHEKKEKTKRQPKKTKLKPETTGEMENTDKKDVESVALANFVVHPDGGEKVYTCRDCGLNLDSVTLIQAHIKAEHMPPTKPDYACYVCQQTFKSLGPRNRHLFKNHGLREVKIEGGYDVLPAPKFTCDECKTEFADKRALNKHIRLYHRIRKCPDCPVALIKKELARHRSDVHGMSMPTCQICGYKALKPSTIVKHQSVHQTTCDACKKDFPNKKALVTHNIRYHKTYKCQDCATELPRDELSKHRTEIHGVTTPQCGICGYRHAYESMIVRHQRRVHLQEKNVSCKICDAKFYCQATLGKHMIKHNPVKRFECSFCQKKFPRKSALREHVKIHTGDKKKVCRICDQRFVQKASLNYHMAKYHPEAYAANVSDFTRLQGNRDVIYSCDLCDARRKSERKIQEHILVTHYNKYNIKCLSCDETFKTREAMGRHLFRCHGMEQAKVDGKFIAVPAQKVACETCKREFPNKDSLRQHLYTNHKFVKCSICQLMVLSEKRGMLRHKAKYHNIIHSCGICGYTYLTKSGIIKHQRKVHLKERNVSCMVCDAKFFGNSQLKRHMVRHNPVKKYACSVCKKMYPRQDTLREHMKIHLDDKRRVCRICGEKFVQTASLSYHMGKYHPDAC